MKVSLRSARVNSNLTQVEAGKKIGVSRKTIQNWEKGVSLPDAEHISRIEAAYSCSYDDIIFLPTNYA